MLSSSAAHASPLGEATPCPPLDADCIAAVLSFVSDDAETIGAALRVSKLWRHCARTHVPSFWAHLSAERFNALHSWNESAPQLCECKALEVLRSGAGRRLRRLDLLGATTCTSCRFLEADSKAGRQAATNTITDMLHALLSAGDDLEELGVSCDTALGSALFRKELFRVMSRKLRWEFTELARRLGPGTPLSRLRVLRLHSNRRKSVNTDGELRCFLDARPSIEELYFTGMGVVEASCIPPGSPLRIHTLNQEPRPRAVDVACGVCGALLWRRLTQFQIAPPFQVQQAAALYTSVPPEREDIASVFDQLDRHDDATMIICRNRCHDMLLYYLADAGSGMVNEHGWRYVIAVGPASVGSDGRPSPPLTTLKPVE